MVVVVLLLRLLLRLLVSTVCVVSISQVVAYTTLLKGLCEAGQIQEAQQAS